jgi:hypothetical protein
MHGHYDLLLAAQLLMAAAAATSIVYAPRRQTATVYRL